jgi:hypothetical protein
MVCGDGAAAWKVATPPMMMSGRWQGRPALPPRCWTVRQAGVAIHGRWPLSPVPVLCHVASAAVAIALAVEGTAV